MKPIVLRLLMAVSVLAAHGCSSAPVESSGEQEGASAARRAAGAVKDGIDSAITVADTGKYVLESGLLTGLYAKEMCSCLFVSKMPDGECFDQVRIPVAIPGLDAVVSSEDLVRVTIDRAARRVTAEGRYSGRIAGFLGITSPINPKATALFNSGNGRFGCRLADIERP